MSSPGKGSENQIRWMENDTLKVDLRGKTVRGGLSTFFGGNISFVLRTVSAIILARLLLPEHYGIISMITAVTVFADSLKDLGLDAATIQKKEITHEQISTIFWINAGVGALLMLLVAAVSPVLAWFYGDPRLIPVALVISCNYLLGGITIQHQALLRRQMLFTKLAGIQVSSIAFGIVIALFVALRGGGYWALVSSQLSANLFYAVGIFWACRWIPGRPQRQSGVRSMLRFSRDVSLANVATFASGGITQLLIGKICGAAPLGLYAQASKLVIIPKEQTRVPLDSIAISALSALQTEPDRYREYCKKIIELYAFVNIALSFYLALFADPIIRVFLGEKWIGAIPIFRVFALTTLVSCFQFPIEFVMYTSGRTKQLVWYTLGRSAIMVLGVAVGLRWGVVGAAVGYCVSFYVYLLPGLYYSLRKTIIGMGLVFQAVLLPAVASCFTAGVLLVYTLYFPRSNDVLYFLYSLILAVIAYGGFWFIVPGGRAKLVTYLSYLSDVLKKR